MSETTRHCSGCGRNLPLDQFGSNGRGGRRRQCRDCVNEGQRARRETARQNERRYRQRHPERVKADTRARVRRWRAANPERAREQTQRAVQRYRERQKEQ
jgi:hypothetical protein